MKLFRAGAAGVLTALALPALADAHPSVYVDDRAQVESPAGSGTFLSQRRYVVANHGFTYVLRESNGDTTDGVFDYKSIPAARRAGKDWAWLLANGTTGAQAHAQCELPVLETETAIRAWQEADAFYGYVPFQKGSAGLEDDPATWIPVVKDLTGVDLATVSDPEAACEALPGATASSYVAADATQSTNAAFNSGLIEHTAAPLKTEITALTGARDALQSLLDAARAELAKLASGSAPAALGLTLPSATAKAATVAASGVSVAVSGPAGTPVKAYLKLGERRARKLGLRSSVLASARATFGADGKTTLTLKPGTNAGRKLRKLDGSIAMSVRVRAGDRLVTATGTLAG